MQHSTTLPRPGEGLKTEKMPGHWVLARLGKRNRNLIGAVALLAVKQ
jgi:hypothetical protein